MATLSVIPYTYKPHKIRRKDHGAKNRLEGGHDFPASEIRQTTPNIHNLEDKSQINGPALDVTPSLSDLSNSAVHDRLSGNQGRHATPQSCKHLADSMYIVRPIDLENEVNDHGNFISETTHVNADHEDSEHVIDERSQVTPESGGYDIGTDQEPASKELSTLNSVSSPISSPYSFDVLPFAGSPTSWHGEDSIVVGEPEISYLDGFRKLDEEDQQEIESVPEGCSIIIERDEAHGGMRPLNQRPKVRGDTVRNASIAATREGTRNTQGPRYPKRKRASIVDKTARQSQSKRQRLSPPDSENDSSSEDDDEDDEDDADYEQNETRNNDHALSPSSACDQGLCDDDIVNPEMLIPVYIPQKYLQYLARQPSMNFETTRVKSGNLKRKPAFKAPGTRYTEDDDKQLLELKEERGMSWQETQKEYFPDRVINSLQVHYCTKVNPKRKKDHVLHA
jgi:hypothetical protein